MGNFLMRRKLLTDTYHSPRQGNRSRLPSPFRVASSAYLLLDDTIHAGVQKVSQKVEEKIGVNRTKLALSALGVSAGSFTCFVAYHSASAISNPRLSLKVKLAISIGLPAIQTIVLICNLRLVKDIIHLARRSKTVTNSAAIDPIDHNFRIFRLPFLLLSAGMYLLCYSTNFYPLTMEVFYLQTASQGIVMYIVSSSNGMLDKAKSLAKAAKEHVVSWFKKPEPIPEPGPVSQYSYTKSNF